MQKRAELYMKTLGEEEFDGNDYISWICRVAQQYKENNNMSRHEPIRCNAAFTEFIERQVEGENNES